MVRIWRSIYEDSMFKIFSGLRILILGKILRIELVGGVLGIDELGMSILLNVLIILRRLKLVHVLYLFTVFIWVYIFIFLYTDFYNIE